MVLYADATVELDAPAEDTITCALKYYPSSCADDPAACATLPLYTATTSFASGGTRSASKHLYRLIPGTTYGGRLQSL